MRRAAIFTVISLAALGCAPTVEEGAYSGRRGNSPGTGKADGYNLGYGYCETAIALQFLNDSSTGITRLREAIVDSGLRGSERIGRPIIASRNGVDGEIGSPDDEPFGELGDLLHPSIDMSEQDVRQLVDSLVGDQCIVDWGQDVDWSQADPSTAARFMHAGSNLSTTGGGRDSSEIEVALGINGVAGTQLHAALETRRGFRRVRRARIVEAFTYGFEPNQMPWGSEHHAAREGYPLVALTIEGDRFIVEAEEINGQTEYPDLEPRIDFGTDLNSDTYYDTRDFLLLQNDATVRGRIRWDGVDCIRRLLVAAKFGTGEVDPVSGIKEVAKMDVRTDSGGCGTSAAHDHLQTLDESIRRGEAPWTANVPALAEVHTRLSDLMVLPDVTATNPADATQTQDFEAALGLEPQVHIMSTRSRFHFNEASINRVSGLYTHGLNRLGEVVTYLDEKGLNGGTVAELRAAISQAQADLPADTSTFTTATNLDALNSAEQSADAASEILHRIGRILGDDDTDNYALISQITGSDDDNDDEDRVKAFVAWRKIADYKATRSNNLMRELTVDVFREYYRTNMSDPSNPDHVAERQAFQDYALAARSDNSNPYEEHFEDFEELTSEQDWQDFVNQMDFEWFKTTRRQIEAAGSAAKAVWFDAARAYHVPSSFRSSGNFVIDTMDFTEFMTHREWGNLTALADGPYQDLDYNPRHVLHSNLVNELQIELGSEAPYVERVKELDGQIRTFVDAEPSLAMTGVCEVSNATAVNDATIVEALESCAKAKFVLETYKGVLTYVGLLKGDDIVDRVQDVIEDNPRFGPPPRDIAWAPTQQSKGQTALLLMTGRL